MLIKKMIKHGNSSALVIDKPIMDILKIKSDTLLELSTDGKNLIVSPITEGSRQKKFQNSLEKINKKHGKTLKKLAE